MAHLYSALEPHEMPAPTRPNGWRISLDPDDAARVLGLAVYAFCRSVLHLLGQAYELVEELEATYGMAVG